ncbi:MAG: rRNA small subunit methyltransferase 1, partial [Oscillospiraceae bacterium]|nr:rRNA small subunit methyltransferase 1 [Oscillospiraceae bacterium]
GEELVKQCAEAGITVCAIPGPCAVITALSISGQSTGRFCFEGFLSTAKKSRKEHLESLVTETRTMIFYEAPHKLLTTLEDMASVFGADRSISLCRELTKLHEEVVRTTLGEAIEKYTAQPPKGEFVLVLAGAPEQPKEVATTADAVTRLKELMASGISRKDAIRQTAKELDLPKNEVYDAALTIE